MDNLDPRALLCWYKPASVASGANFAGKFGGGGSNSWFRDLAKIGIYIAYVTGEFEGTTSNILTANVWHFLVLKADSSNPTAPLVCYWGTETLPMAQAAITLTSSSGLGGFASEASGSLEIAGLDFANGGDGALSRVGYVQGDITLAQAEQLRRRGVAAWPGILGSGLRLASAYSSTSDLTDVSGNGNNGTNNGCSSGSDGDFPGPPTRRMR